MVQDKLAETLQTYSNAYNNGTPLVPDSVYDALEAKLRLINPDHPVLKLVGAPGDAGWPKVQHPVPMGSLDKAQTKEEMASFLSDKRGPYCTTEKLDGISLLLTYKNGLLVQGATRGDGTTGDDITRNVRIMQGAQKSIPTTEVDLVQIRAEVLCLKTDFAQHFQGESNPRNTASGTAKRQTGWQKARHLTIVAYNIFGVDTKTRSEQLELLRSWGFKTPEYALLNRAADVYAHYDSYYKDIRSNQNYDVDGLVVEIDSLEEQRRLGSTPDGLRPKGSLAFKFPHDQKGTTLRDIRWQVGASGRITPVAIFDTLSLAGVQVQQASIHNLAHILRLTEGKGFHAGDYILVSRRNDVIPQVESVLVEEATGAPFTHPELCPSCESPTGMSGEYLVCTGEECPAQTLGNVRRWVSKIGVLHFGEATIQAVIDSGLCNSLGDLYRITEKQLSELEHEGTGKVGGSASRILESLHANKNLSLDLFIGSLGIPLCGRRMIGMLVDAGIDSLEKLQAAKVADLEVVPNFGPVKALAFRKGFDARKEIIADLLSAGVSIKEVEKVAPVGNRLAGVTVCFTGFRDAALEQSIVVQGGEIKSGVAKGLTYLVTKDPTSGSSKIQKAQSLGVKVISPEEMRKLVS